MAIHTETPVDARRDADACGPVCEPAEARPGRALSATQARVLSLLTEAGKPLSAYDLLGRMRADGVNAPPTVYRALDKLIGRGLAHRIESLNAFVACGAPHHGELAAFAICDGCGAVDEITDAGMEATLGALASARGFHASRVTVELRGRCGACAHAGQR